MINILYSLSNLFWTVIITPFRDFFHLIHKKIKCSPPEIFIFPVGCFHLTSHCTTNQVKMHLTQIIKWKVFKQLRKKQQLRNKYNPHVLWIPIIKWFWKIYNQQLRGYTKWVSVNQWDALTFHQDCDDTGQDEIFTLLLRKLQWLTVWLGETPMWTTKQCRCFLKYFKIVSDSTWPTFTIEIVSLR